MAKVLVIEDDWQVRNMLQFMLEREGFEVLTAENGRDALRVCAESLVDVVVLDLFMPEMDGLETLQILKNRYGIERIVAISGGGQHGMYDFLRVARSLGAQFTFIKPIDRKKLVSAVRALAFGNPVN